MIEFVSYDGAYPNLCSGILTVKVDGEVYRFGHGWFDSLTNSGKGGDDQLLPPFWQSGGSCGFDDEWNEMVCSGCPWVMSDEVKKDKYPPEIKARLRDILEVMNQNVPGGCCGGCL